MASELASQPPPTPAFLLSYPAPHVLLVTMNRPKYGNSLAFAAHWEAHELFRWFDSEPSLCVAIVTGAGKTFCAGQDLMEQQRLLMLQQQHANGDEDAEPMPHTGTLRHPPSGFMGLSRRAGKKPVIAAVNGAAIGGGFEMCLGSDIVIAAPTATFSLPEIALGLYAACGGLTRLARLAGMARATDIAMTGRKVTAAEAAAAGIIARVSPTPLEEAIQVAKQIVSYNPDCIIATRAGLRQAWEDGSVERAAQNHDNMYRQKIQDSENFMIGMMAFAMKEKPLWVPSKL